MAWNQKSAVYAMAITVQTVGGTFTAPSSATDLIGVSAVTTTPNAITATDNTATGTIWKAPDARLGVNHTVGGTIPLRGPGGSAPPALGAWPVGRIFRAAGWTETVNATSRTANFGAIGSNMYQITLANSESSTDDALIGMPIQYPALGSSGTLNGTSLIQDYNGTTKVATVPELAGSNPANASQYTVPAYLSYVLGTLTTAPPLLSISVWRDKRREDFMDWRPTSFSIDAPVTNNQNTNFPSIDFSGTGTKVASVDDTTPSNLSAILAVKIAPCRNGKFRLDRTLYGHQDMKYTQSTTLGAASDQNTATGQDSYDILSGTRTIALDLNQGATTDLDLESRVNSQLSVSAYSSWGYGAGNQFGFMSASGVLGDLTPGDRNGYWNLTGDLAPDVVDKAMAFTIWW